MLTVIILAGNESLHIERCVRSAQRVADDVLVVDSYSADDTVILARRSGARVVQNHWANHATQVNWALDSGNIHTDWIMRLDADEVLDDQLASSVRGVLSNASDEIGGFEINRRIRFMGREIRHGGMSPLWVTRFFRNGRARCEARWMDEHMVLSSGRVARLPGFIIDDNLNSLTWWTQKHNHYASREAVDLLDREYGLRMADEGIEGLNRQARLKRWLKVHVYALLPLGVRPWLYFLYRMVLRLGILDGASGMLFHTLQGLWYRLLVDAKIREVRQIIDRDGCDLAEAVRRALAIEIRPQKAALTKQAES